MSGSVTRRGVTSRRGFLRLAGGAAGAAVLAACGAPGGGERSEGTPEAETRLIGAPPIDEREVVAVLERPPRPEPAWARGDRRQLERLALPGTDWETPIYINRSGEPGPSVMVLGGVHGNEPGGWAAAETIADWMPDRGLTVVIPRANIVATEAFERTLPELGDLNRFYPGEPAESVNAFPMQWMAYSIIELAREFEVSLLLDLHESWGFFNERSQNGTAFLGQTVTNGASTEETGRIEAVALEVNEQITEREQLVIRDRFRNRYRSTTPNTNFDPSWPRGGTSSLGIGQFVPGLVPVLIEMGQQDQPEARRSELHQLIVRTSLRHEGMLTA